MHPVAHPRGVLATSGGWAYCLVVELAENARLLGAYSRTVPPIARD